MTSFNIVVDLFLLIVTCAFLLALLLSKTQNSHACKIFLCILGVNVFALVFDELLVTKYLTYSWPILSNICVYGKYSCYLITGIFSSCFFKFANEDKKNDKILNIVIILNVLVFVVSVAILFFDKNTIKIISGGYKAGSHYFILSISLIVQWMFNSISAACCINENSNILYIFVCILIIAAIVLQYFQSDFYGSLLYGLTISNYLVYLKLRSDRTTKYVKQERELANAQSELLLSQIRPHFLYNALSAIGDLCTTDPQKASKMIDDFAFYLRGNIDSINNSNTVAFKDELKHIQYYINLCQLRFGDKVKANFDIQVDDFMVPTLSLEPFVENAIEHGIKKKKGGGTVSISTYQKDEKYYIIIADDGVGFDATESTKSQDKTRSHVGLKNATERIKMISDGTVEINSVVDVGTKITICLKGD